MKIISANIGTPAVVEWRGMQIKTGIYKYPVEESISLEHEDVEHDHVMDRRYHGGVDKACYLYSADVYGFWREKYPEAEWGWGMFGENLTVEGLDESSIRIGDCFRIGEAEVQVTQPRQPCYKLGIRFGTQQMVEDFWHAPYPGVYVRVLKPGRVKKGDDLVMLRTDLSSLSVREVFSIFRAGREDQCLIKQAINEPFLADSCRRDIARLQVK